MNETQILKTQGPAVDSEQNPTRPASSENHGKSNVLKHPPISAPSMPPISSVAANTDSKPAIPLQKSVPADSQNAAQSADEEEDARFELFGPVQSASAGTAAGQAHVHSEPRPETPGARAATPSGEAASGEDDRKMRHAHKMVAKLSSENSDLQVRDRPAGPGRVQARAKSRRLDRGALCSAAPFEMLRAGTAAAGGELLLALCSCALSGRSRALQCACTLHAGSARREQVLRGGGGRSRAPLGGRCSLRELPLHPAPPIPPPKNPVHPPNRSALLSRYARAPPRRRPTPWHY